MVLSGLEVTDFRSEQNYLGVEYTSSNKVLMRSSLHFYPRGSTMLFIVQGGKGD